MVRTVRNLLKGDYAARVRRALTWQRLAVVLVMTTLWSTRRLLTADMAEFFTPLELVVLGVELFAEMAVIAGVLMLSYTLLDEALSPQSHTRLLWICAMLVVVSVAMTAALYAYYGHTFNDLPPPLRLFADSLRWGLPAALLAVVAHVHRRAIQTEVAAHAEERFHAQLGLEETEQQLALLQAQIEPHFLFNVLGNVRRLYRTEPQAGAQTIASLMRYLREALPRVRSERSQLRDELELVRAYLDLFRVRMGERLSFAIECDPALEDVEFPPMLLVTLVENAIKHGVEPSGRRGHVLVRAQRRGRSLEVAVTDDGAGFGAVPSGGTGVGLANLRRQLAARYGSAGRFSLESPETGGVRATIEIPLRVGAAVDGALRRLAPA